ncbi:MULTISPECIES: benzoate-CoA ligase family protein [unclassified Polaromonas]|uniref:benzoate-CoA ligase family protein n=1 Tax=unclassified Polaromonas TaxID=2638319 RepID=UPI000F079EB4|nr:MULTISPECIES: benzoate-CoA ligase family protein [unclassified Polaromonas]AYQ29686.1 benzoate-CoA ligase family protein [Polaromonas sp. SP1]QGJ19200.1 benzoate-CoA ligase family protein [Polaromonas sp. Pch-P]
MQTSSADHSASPPLVTIPRDYNAAHDLLARNASRTGKVAFMDALTGEQLTYGELTDQSHRFANALRAKGFTPESRVLLAMLDTPQWPVVFLGCILAGVVPVAANTLLTTQDFDFMLRDSRAQGLVVSKALLPSFEPLIGKIDTLKTVILAGTDDSSPYPALASMLAGHPATKTIANTCADDACFWLYSSGSTGTPKGTVHLHSHLVQTAELYGRGVLGIRESDVVYSAAKLFFAYGLGNALTFPMSVGATTVLLPARPAPADVFALLKKYQPTIFYGVPTLYAALLADPAKPAKSELRLRVCTSAGEALPAEIGKKWTAHYGCEILDGIGSTEMLHIFLSNRPGQVRYGTTGQAVPGYALRIIGDDGRECGDGEIGELQISGPSAAIMYWNNRAKTKATFAGEWTKSGDKYTRDADGYYTYGGRSDDMLKVGGIYVSPFEVEASLMTHAAVLEVAVIGVADDDQLIKPKAYVVLKPGQAATMDELKAHVKQQLAPYKYPRWIEFVGELPKTATGKIQRFKLRQGTA